MLRSPLESGKKSSGADKHLVLDDLWIDKIDNSDLAAQLAILSDSKCPESLLRYVWRLEWFKEHWLYPFVNWYLQAIAQNPKTPEYIVRDLISHSCYFVQEAAAANPAFNIEESAEILKSGNRHVLLGCLNNTNTSKATKTQIRKLLKDTDAYPLHWMEISESTDDDELSMHPQRFHNLILGDAKLLYEEIFCTDEDYMTHDLSELKACYSDDENFFQEHPEIAEHANEVFFYEFDQYKNGIPAFYQVSIYIPDYEATAVRVVGINDVLEKFIRERGAYEELWSWVYDEHTWLCSCRDIRLILKYCEAAR